jgi:transcription antitermination factor NusG
MSSIIYLKTPELGDGDWYVCITNPNCQRRAELELYSLGFRTFAPKLRKWVSHARVRKAVERPLLGRYLFVELSNTGGQSFGAVKAVNGIEGFVGVCGVPQSVPSHYVEDFRMRYMSGEWDFVSKETMPIGARVRVVEGEFNEMLATVIRRRRTGKVELKFVGTAISRTVYEVSVRPAA